MTPLITMIVPAYGQGQMVARQIKEWEAYSPETLAAFTFVIVDDCSPIELSYLVIDHAYPKWLGEKLHLYRIDEDLPWNRSMARNLGTRVSDTPWLLHVDTDHVLPAESAAALVKKFEHATPTNQWYRFKRRRIGAADETRKKDAVALDATNVEIHPHIDSYLCTKEAYERAGGYNELFGGVLGGGSPFLKEMERANGAPAVLPVELHVHTRHSVLDSSERTLPRDPAAFKKRKQEIMAQRGTLKYSTKEWLRLPYHRVF